MWRAESESLSDRTEIEKEEVNTDLLRMTRAPIYEAELTEFQTDEKTKEKAKADEASHDARNQKREENHKPTNLKHIWRTFMNETTCHGLKIIVNPANSMLVRVSYALIVLASLVSLHTTIRELSLRALEYKTVTRTEIYIEESMSFPTVTLCSASPLSFRINKENDSWHDLLAQVSAFGGSLHEVDINRSDIQTLLQRTTSDIFSEYSLDIDMPYVEYDGTYLGMDYFETLDTPNGRCFQFNSPNFVARNGAWRSTNTGPDSGLRAVVNIRPDDDRDSEYETAEIRVYISETKISPSVHTHFLELVPGTSTLVSVRANKIKFLPSPYKSYGSEPCVNLDEDNPEMKTRMVNASFYSFEMCRDQCVAYKASKECSCYNPSLVIPGLKSCTVYEYILGCYSNASKHFMKNVATECDCPRPCSLTLFDVTLSSSQLLSKARMKNILKHLNSSSMEKIRESYFEVQVFYESPLVRMEKHDPEYTFANFISSLGGQMGICLGASLISLAELIECILHTISMTLLKLPQNLPKFITGIIQRLALRLQIEQIHQAREVADVRTPKIEEMGWKMDYYR